MSVYHKNNKSRTMKNSSKAVSKKSRKQKHRSKKTRKNIKNGGGEGWYEEVMAPHTEEEQKYLDTLTYNDLQKLERSTIPYYVRARLTKEEKYREVLEKIATNVQKKYEKKKPEKNTRTLQERIDHFIGPSTYTSTTNRFYQNSSKDELAEKKALVKLVLTKAKKAYKKPSQESVNPDELVRALLKEAKDKKIVQEQERLKKNQDEQLIKNQEQARKTKNPAQQTQTKPWFGNKQKSQTEQVPKVQKH